MYILYRSHTLLGAMHALTLVLTNTHTHNSGHYSFRICCSVFNLVPFGLLTFSFAYYFQSMEKWSTGRSYTPRRYICRRGRECGGVCEMLGDLGQGVSVGIMYACILIYI